MKRRGRTTPHSLRTWLQEKETSSPEGSLYSFWSSFPLYSSDLLSLIHIQCFLSSHQKEKSCWENKGQGKKHLNHFFVQGEKERHAIVIHMHTRGVSVNSQLYDCVPVTPPISKITQNRKKKGTFRHDSFKTWAENLDSNVSPSLFTLVVISIRKILDKGQTFLFVQRDACISLHQQQTSTVVGVREMLLHMSLEEWNVKKKGPICNSQGMHLLQEWNCRNVYPV